jgi:hypothetical protein
VSRSLGAALPADLLARLSQADLPRSLGAILPLVTVDEAGRPHPMLLSSLEVRAVDPRTLRVAIGGESRSARNLAARRVATLLIVEPERTAYVKARLVEGPRPVAGAAGVALFALTVEDVLEDAPAEWEGQVRITGGPTYAPAPSLSDPRVRATLAALAGGPAVVS